MQEAKTGTEQLPTITDVLAAARRIRGIARATPLERSHLLSEAAGTEVFLKLENQQRTGAFKLRGAVNALASLDAEARARGVVTASAGNHGVGISWASGTLGIPATVFVPATAAATKRRRIARFGATLREIPGGYDEAHHAAEAYAAETGLPFVNAFSDPEVVAGQGTVGLEIFAELPEVRTVVTPAGGGGLLGGVGIVSRALGPGVRVIGVQTEATNAMHESLRAGELRSPPILPTLCEGLSGDIDARSLALARRVVDEVVLVTEAGVRRAIRALYEEEGIVAEASAAVVVAAFLEGRLPELRGPVAVVVSGGNIDAALLAAILSE